MKTKEEIVEKLRDRLHRAQRKWFKRFPDRPKQELYDEFCVRINTPEILLKEHKDIVTLLWVLGEFDLRSEECQSGSPGKTDGITMSPNL